MFDQRVQWSRGALYTRPIFHGSRPTWVRDDTNNPMFDIVVDPYIPRSRHTVRYVNHSVTPFLVFTPKLFHYIYWTGF